MKLPFLFLLIFSLLVGIYLNRVYANFFNRIGEIKLADPYLELPRAEITVGTTTDSPITYLALGDSLSRGVGSESYKNTFPYLFTLKRTENKIHLVNRAQPGARISHLASQLKTAGELKPDIITVLIGINDIFNFTPIEDFSHQYDSLLTDLDKKDAKVIVMTIPYLGSPEAVTFPYNYLLDREVKRFNTEIKHVVGSHPNTELVDLYKLTQQQFKKDRSLYSKDLFHPSDKGYILISDILNHANFSQ